MGNKLSVITGVTLLCAACAPIPNSSIESSTYQAGQSMIETYPDMLRSSDIPIDHIIVLLIFRSRFTHIYWSAVFRAFWNCSGGTLFLAGVSDYFCCYRVDVYRQ